MYSKNFKRSEKHFDFFKFMVILTFCYSDITDNCSLVERQSPKRLLLCEQDGPCLCAFQWVGLGRNLYRALKQSKMILCKVYSV